MSCPPYGCMVATFEMQQWSDRRTYAYTRLLVALSWACEEAPGPTRSTPEGFNVAFSMKMPQDAPKGGFGLRNVCQSYCAECVAKKKRSGRK